MAEARVLVGAEEDELVKLYYAPLNEEGKVVDKDLRQQMINRGAIESAVSEGGGVVWICVGGSPTQSPLQRKPRSPFLVKEHAGVEFEELPELYEDDAYSGMKKALLSKSVDRRVISLMAIPGSGKTRTVMSACAHHNMNHVRVKFLDAESDLIRECIKNAGPEIQTYEDWKSRLRPLILGPLEEALGGVADGVDCVLHVDDCQTLMGSRVVTREEWDAMELGKRNPWDLVMPTVCSVLHGLMNQKNHIRSVVSGTNFFANLVLSPGSEAKEREISIDGTFTTEWVLEKLVEKYFHIPTELMKSVEEHVAFLSGNRRAIQYFLSELKRVVEPKRAGDTLSTEELFKVRVHAVKLWSSPISKALNGVSAVVVQAVAAIIFHEAFSGFRVGNEIIFRRESLPDAVKNFGLAGGLNLNVLGSTEISVCIPRGCVWELMSTLVDEASVHFNAEEVRAFVRVANSVETGTGHAFERLLACELSMMGRNGQCPLYEWIAISWKGKGKLVPDPLVFGQPFVYESCVRDVAWLPHQVYCVLEKAQDVGNRIVDVGFPIWRIDQETGVRERMRVMCELKKGYTDPQLWRLCWAYFLKMKSYASEHSDVIVCFVASKRFSHTKPVDKEVKNGLSAHNSRKNCLALMAQEARYCILEDVENHSRFPLPEIFANTDVKVEVAELS
jgi:hypothetical protein